jgi:hypothetical protein
MGSGTHGAPSWTNNSLPTTFACAATTDFAPRSKGRTVNSAIYTPIASAVVGLGLTGVVTPTT